MVNRTPILFNAFGPLISVSAKEFLAARDSGDWSSLCAFLGTNALTEEMVDRYKEVTPSHAHPVITSALEKVVQRIGGPLILAKKAYCFGDYTSAMTLCRNIGEMMAHVFYQIEDSSGALSSQLFDEMGQPERIKRLFEHRYVTPPQRKALSEISKVGIPYMHWWSLKKGADEVQTDAKTAVITALELFYSIFNFPLASASSIYVPPKIKDFLEKVERASPKFYNDPV